MQTLNTLTSAHFAFSNPSPSDAVRIDDLKRLLNARKPLQHWTIWVGIAAILALQIAGPSGLAGSASLPGPTWVYPTIAILFLVVAVAVRLGTERDLLAMELNAMKLRSLRDTAAREAMAARG
jgi:hypothetical protein